MVTTNPMATHALQAWRILFIWLRGPCGSGLDKRKKWFIGRQWRKVAQFALSQSPAHWDTTMNRPAGDRLWQARGNVGFEWSWGHTSTRVTHFQHMRWACPRQTVYTNYLLTGNRTWIWKAWSKQALLLLALSQLCLPRRQGSEINRCRASRHMHHLLSETQNSWARKQCAPSVGRND